MKIKWLAVDAVYTHGQHTLQICTWYSAHKQIKKNWNNIFNNFFFIHRVINSTEKKAHELRLMRHQWYDTLTSNGQWIFYLKISFKFKFAVKKNHNKWNSSMRIVNGYYCYRLFEWCWKMLYDLVMRLRFLCLCVCVTLEHHCVVCFLVLICFIFEWFLF